MEGRDVGARRAGEKLLGEVVTEGLGELLHSLRELCRGDAQSKAYFGVPELDALLPSPPQPPITNANSNPTNAAPYASNRSPVRAQNYDDDFWDPNDTPQAPGPAQRPPVQQPLPHQPQDVQRTKKLCKATPSILEILSPPPTHHASSAGKTSLIYLITALAILPSSLSGIALDGRNAAVAILDPMGHFSATRLVEVMIGVIKGCIASKVTDMPETMVEEIRTCVKRSLQHVHIFRPHSWDGLMATLEALPEYLFNEGRHHSINRRIHAIVLEDLDSLYWSLRSSSSTSSTPNIAASAPAITTNPIVVGTKRLTAQLTHLSTLLSSAIILTSTSSTAIPSQFRSLIPLNWPKDTNIMRLAVRRVDVVPFRPEISIEEAEEERSKRWDIVKKGRFECFKIGKEDEGFAFRVSGEGVRVERDGK